MVIVAGHITVEPGRRQAYLAGCEQVVALARRAPGCLDFAISADLLDADRINIYERWETQSAVEAFRASGPDDDQQTSILAGAVEEYDVSGSRTLMG
ncbi:antibiotic biosynthesis monooxygenase family protein [Gordonia sp. PKS22-38]|uniref:Antibiotic biosynthesis monooxygenase family protein n=1 Tax=Gordonia prachuapensis TaxID=3115651 RepID=A0ABU7MW28_9ACTN|nr:antibiotic biosynthesis monooxygenase family protein [Gordonia sp. PKS22-38]